MSAEEPDLSSHHIDPGLRPENLDNSSTTDYAAGMGTSQAIESAEEQVGKSMNVEKKKMKKKIFLVPQEKLDYYLSFRPKPVSRRLIERDPPAAAEREKVRERIFAEQERMRREYEANGYATYVAEVPDDGARYQGELGDVDEEEKDAAAALVKQAEVIVDEKKEEDVAAEADGAGPLPHGRGRRRFRPGVVKQAGGGIKKIIM